MSLGQGEAILDNWEPYTQWSVSLSQKKLKQEEVQVEIEVEIVMNDEQIRDSHELPRVTKNKDSAVEPGIGMQLSITFSGFYLLILWVQTLLLF